MAQFISADSREQRTTASRNTMSTKLMRRLMKDNKTSQSDSILDGLLSTETIPTQIESNNDQKMDSFEQRGHKDTTEVPAPSFIRGLMSALIHEADDCSSQIMLLFQKLLGASIFWQLPAPLVPVILAGAAARHFSNWLQWCFPDKVYVCSLRQLKGIESLNNNGLEKFRKYKLIIVLVLDGVLKSAFKIAQEINSSALLRSGLNRPDNRVVRKATVMIVSSSYSMKIPFPRNTDTMVYPITLPTHQGQEHLYVQHANIGYNHDEHKRVDAWLRHGAELAAKDGMSRASISNAVHVWRMKNDMIYRFVQLKCIKTSTKITTDEFRAYLHHFLRGLGISEVPEKGVITPVLEELEFKNEARNTDGKSERWYHNIDVSSKFRQEVAHSRRSKKLLNDIYDLEQRGEA